MTIIERITADRMSARKSKDEVATSLITTLMSAILTVGKDEGREVTDQDSIAKVRSFLKSNAELLAALEKSRNGKEYGLPAEVVAFREKTILEGYLPKQLTEDEIRAHAQAAIATGIKDMGGVMAYLKKNFEGTYDGKAASRIAKEETSK